jgi:putative serine protease PepD
VQDTIRDLADGDGIRVRRVLHPDADGSAPRRGRLRRFVLLSLAGLLLLSAPVTSIGLIVREQTTNAGGSSADRRSISELQARVLSLEAQMSAQTDWGAIARAVQPSIFTVATDHGLGSGWVARAGAGGSDVVTNFHVVAEAFNAGDVAVHVRQGDLTIEGSITQVLPGEDLAIVHIAERFPALPAAIGRPQLGDSVMAVGSPLGLGGTVSLGVISGFRSVEGADYIQFSAAISPGNSGGPVVDRHGSVVAVAAAKFTGTGVEALSLAIPVQTVCTMVGCSRSNTSRPAGQLHPRPDRRAGIVSLP